MDGAEVCCRHKILVFFESYKNRGSDNKKSWSSYNQMNHSSDIFVFRGLLQNNAKLQSMGTQRTHKTIERIFELL